MNNYIKGDTIDGSAIIYKKENLSIVKGLLLADGTEKWFKVLDFGAFSDGLASIDTGSEFGYINRKGEFIIQPEYMIGTEFSCSRAFVTHGCDTILINKSGKEIKSWDEAYVASPFSDGIAQIVSMKRNGEYMERAYVNTQGETVIPFGETEKISQPDDIINENESYSCGLIRIKRDGKYGFINLRGEMVIPPVFNYAYSFRDGLACFRNSDGYGFINLSGDIAIPPIYDSAFMFNNGSALVKNGREWHKINTNGEILCTRTVDYIRKRMGGYYSFFSWENNGEGLFDSELNEIYPQVFDEIKDVNEGIVSFVMDGKAGVIDLHGNMITSDVAYFSEYTFKCN